MQVAVSNPSLSSSDGKAVSLLVGVPDPATLMVAAGMGTSTISLLGVYHRSMPCLP